MEVDGDEGEARLSDVIPKVLNQVCLTPMYLLFSFKNQLPHKTVNFIFLLVGHPQSPQPGADVPSFFATPR